MKSLLQQKEDILSITSGSKVIEIGESDNFFNHSNKLAVDNNVTVSKTMIKITYKKALKDQSLPDNTFDGDDSNVMNVNTKQTETSPLYNSDILNMVKSFAVTIVDNKTSVFHSTPKALTQNEKKKKYLNGLNLSPKSNLSDGKNRLAKVQQKPASQKEGASGLKRPETVPDKQIYKSELEKRFLKCDGLEKPKDSIFETSKADSKIKLNKGSDKKIKKLKNEVKKRKKIDKKCKKIEGIKRKSSSTGLDVVTDYKKIKLSKTSSKVMECSEENNRSGSGKKPIMLVDPDLPVGWSRFIRTKNKGSANEQYVVYVVNPQGKKFRFKWKLRKFLERTNSSLDPDQFFFGLYQRPKTNTSAISKGDVSTQSETEKKSSECSRESESELSAESDSQMEENEDGNNESNNGEGRNSKGKELLLYDPDLPFGWKRIIHSDATNGKKQVHIISPDGKIFRRRYRLNEYLIKHQYNHSLNRFYFGLYPKKEGNNSENEKETEKKTLTSVKTCKPDDSLDFLENTNRSVNDSGMISNGENKDVKDSKIEVPDSPMIDDPNLPEGWKRVIKIRSYGETAGRMEVVIVSPDGRKHRTRKHLEHYLMQEKLNYKAEDFDFTLFGKANSKKQLPQPDSESEPEPVDISFLGMKKKFTDKPVPELDISSLKDTVITPEGHMINTVNGLMMCSGVSSVRNVRRQRLPRGEHEKQLKAFLSSEGDVANDGCDIPVRWVEKLVKCRDDFRTLEPDAASTVAETTKDFIKTLVNQALAISEQPENGLRYEDLAELIDRNEGLSFLKTLIPKKITFKEYIKLNRPKKFTSFT